VIKTLLIIFLTYALVPLIVLQNSIPKYLFTASFVFIHIVVLAVYMYGVRYQSLDVEWKSLGVRLLGLAFAIALLILVSSSAWKHSIIRLVLLMLVLCSIHLFILMLLLVRVCPVVVPVEVASLTSAGTTTREFNSAAPPELIRIVNGDVESPEQANE
jgi:hypothetical protein